MEQPNLTPQKASKETHLLPNIKPIRACIGSGDDFGYLDLFLLKHGFNPSDPNIEKIDLDEEPSVLTKNNFSNAGHDTYVISPANSKDKISEHFQDCTGVIVAGVDRDTGENISIMSHQNPGAFLSAGKNKDQFLNDLAQILQQIKARCLPNTVDAVIIGGKYMTIADIVEIDFRQNYLDSLSLLSTEVSSILGFEPIIINGPKLISSADRVLYNNKERRLFFIRGLSRDAVNENTGDFTYSNIAEEKKKWDKYLATKKS